MNFTEEEPTTLGKLRPGPFMLNGVMWVKLDAPEDAQGVPVVAPGGEQSYLGAQAMVTPVTQVIKLQERPAFAWVAELIAQMFTRLDINHSAEVIADQLLRGMGIPDEWTEHQLRRWIKFGIDVGGE